MSADVRTLNYHHSGVYSGVGVGVGGREMRKTSRLRVAHFGTM